MPLPSSLAPVAPLDLAYLPKALAPSVGDIADRMQCAPDFPAVAMMVAAGSIIGNRVTIRPKQKDSWSVTPNLWAMCVGRPGVMKSPAINESLAPLKRFEARARKENDAAYAAFKRQQHEYRLRAKAAEDAYRKATNPSAPLNLPDEPAEPKAKRYIVSDNTYEALAVILANNPNGVCLHRDEIASMLNHLTREENATARGFILTAWNGADSYTFDRIQRGHLHLETACLSMLGSIQPGKLAAFIGHAHKGGECDDGMIQRFNLLVWPDQSGEWKHVDRHPDSNAIARANAAFDGLDQLSPNQNNTNYDINSHNFYLNFDDQASLRFIEWLSDLERRLRSGELNASVESHLAKYRKLVPALSLINHLVDYGIGSIGIASLERAIAYASYFESHAMRAYGAGVGSEATTARAILSRIRKGEITDDFTLRDIHQRNWSNLTDRDAVKAGLDLLVDHGWIRAGAPVPHATGGRPTTRYQINPKGLA